MIEGILFWLDLGLMIYLCWKIIKKSRGESDDLGLFSMKEMDQKK
jgi:hypothetical protein